MRRRGDETKFEAVVEAFGNECDLALLRVLDARDGSDSNGSGNGGGGSDSGGGNDDTKTAAGSPQMGKSRFFEGLEELRFGALPELQDEVDVLGYPVGGESMSVTSGVVSRVDMQEYSQGGNSLLALQIDAAINPGNSGGPVVNLDQEVVGVAFQSLNSDEVENIGYVVPVTVVEHFLEDIRRNSGRYTGFCALGIHFCTLENDSFRGYLGMTPAATMRTRAKAIMGGGRFEQLDATKETSLTGVMVKRVDPRGSAWGHLLDGDVLLAIDGIKVANDGSIPFRRGERVAISHYVSMRFAGDTINCRVLRCAGRSASGGHSVGAKDGDRRVHMEVTVPMAVSQSVVPYHWNNQLPPYLIVGGLVFTALSVPFLEAEGAYDNWVSDDIAYLMAIAAYPDSMVVGEVREQRGRGRKMRAQNEASTDGFGDSSCSMEVVVLTQVLAHRANLGYEHLTNKVLHSFNSERVTSLAHLDELINSAYIGCRDGSSSSTSCSHLRFEFAPSNNVVVLEIEAAKAATDEVCDENSVQHPVRILR